MFLLKQDVHAGVKIREELNFITKVSLGKCQVDFDSLKLTCQKAVLKKGSGTLRLLQQPNILHARPNTFPSFFSQLSPGRLEVHITQPFSHLDSVFFIYPKRNRHSSLGKEDALAIDVLE
jgi:hypothetical protein